MTCEEMIYSNDYVDIIINFIPGYRGAEQFLDTGCANFVTSELAILHVPRGEEFLFNLENTPYATVPKLYGLMDSSNMEAVGVKQVQDPNGLNLHGDGVIVGIVDTGIDYENPLFRKEDGSTRIGVIWDQTMQGENDSTNQNGPAVMEQGEIPRPVYGRIFGSAAINQILSGDGQGMPAPSKDTNGHGTFMAGIAAGGVDNENDFTGIATQSEIAVVKLKEAKPYLKEYFGVPQELSAYSETDIIYAVSYLFQYAEWKNQPISILIGLGTSFGGHRGLTFLERYLEKALEKIRVMVSAPAGNEGNERLHFEGRLNSEQEQQVEISVGEGQENLVIEFWGKKPATFAIGLISPEGDRISRIPPRFGQEEILRLPLSGTEIYVAYQLIEVYSGDEFIFIRLSNPTPGLWRIIVYGAGEKESEFNMWLPLRQFLQQDTYFLQGTPGNTITAPGNTESVMTMTAYNYLNDSIYANASRGYNTNGLVKPNLVAPGVNVAGPGLRNNYVRRTGTSVAAAHSAGMLALLLQWIKDNAELGIFYTRQIQSLFEQTAVRQPDMVYPNPVGGYGIMDIERVFESFRVTES